MRLVTSLLEAWEWLKEDCSNIKSGGLISSSTAGIHYEEDINTSDSGRGVIRMSNQRRIRREISQV